MEVGRHSIVVRKKLTWCLGKTSLYFETSTWQERHYWFTISRHHLSGTVFSFITFLKHSQSKTYSLGVSSTWWPLNRGDNRGRTLFGMAKGLPRPLIDSFLSRGQQIAWNKRKFQHVKRVQFPQDFFCTQTWPPIHCFVHTYGCRDVMWKWSIEVAT